MDQTQIVKMLAGTITRGVLWILAFLAGKLGIESVSQETAQAIGFFIASGLVALAAMAWSWYKNRKLLNTVPPKSAEPVTPHDGATL